MLRRRFHRTRLTHDVRGMALILVVMVLSSMLLLGTVFLGSVRLDHMAAVTYSRTGQAEIFALEGLHRAMSEIMYDAWGVNEDKAFVCAPEWGQLTQGTPVEGINMVSAYSYKGTEPVVAKRSLFRRTLTPVFNGVSNVETDFRWVDMQSLDGASLPIQSGGYYWDEFLPDAVDNSDAFETGLMVNHGTATDRDYLNDDRATGGIWTGGFWPSHNGGAAPPWDYIDTRIVPDSFLHIFRFDLLDPVSKQVRCTGVKDQDPKQLVPDHRNNLDFKASHLGFAVNAGPTWLKGDVWGGAININQVNNNYNWEIYYNWRDYTDGADAVPKWTPHHFNEAKWIAVYDPSGNRVIGRYSATVWPDSGQPNPNYMYDGRLGRDWNQYLEATSEYLLSLDQGYGPHGAAYSGSVYCQGRFSSDPDFGPNKIKSKELEDPPTGYADWYHGICTRFAQHKGTHASIATRAELAMLIRKWGFKIGAVPDEDMDNDGAVISALVSPSSYQYLLGPHWDEDLLLVDVCRNGSLLTGDMPSVTNNFKNRLQNLKFYWGPDERNGAEGTYTDAIDPLYRYTPYHEQMPEEVTPIDEWDRRARRAKAFVLAWMGTGREYDGYSGEATYYGGRTVDAYTVGDLVRVPLPKKDRVAQGDLELSVQGALNINEVGRFTPVHPTTDEHANGDGSIGGEGGAVGFDPANPQEYHFVELVQYKGVNRGIVRDTLRQDGSLFVGGADVLLDPTTRIVGRNPDLNMNGIRYNEGDHPDYDSNLYGPTTAGAWSYKNLCIMMAPSNQSNPAGKTNLTWITTMSHNHYSGRTWQRSFPRAHPWNYIVVYFRTIYDGDEVVFVNKNGAVLDYVKLPGKISDLPAPGGAGTGYSYSCPDYTNNLDPNNWQVMAATPSWREKFTDRIGTYWIDGQNINFWPRSWPDYRVDINNISKSCSTDRIPSSIATGRCAYMNITDGARIFIREFDLLRTASGFMPTSSYADLKASMPSALDTDGVYVPYTLANKNQRTWLLHHYFDPDLVIWRDLGRSAPVERLFIIGALSDSSAGTPANHIPDKHTNYAAFDGEDNNLDGLIDAVGTDPINPLGEAGLYLTDRKHIGKINLNLVNHPSAAFCVASFANYNPILQIGRKPLAGYLSFAEWQTRLHYYYGDNTPYDKIVWYDNLFADLSSDHWLYWGGGHLDTELQQTCVNAYPDPAPIYTVYITAQAVTQQQNSLTPTSELKARATVERTWDGKMNLLEFTWIPMDRASVQ